VHTQSATYTILGISGAQLAFVFAGRRSADISCPLQRKQRETIEVKLRLGLFILY
jgi:hypothetical protein